MDFNPNRRALFQRIASPLQTASLAKTPQRPIYSVEESAFLQSCTQCQQCLEACPANVIELTEGYPVLTSSQYCDGCVACVLACPTEALSVGERRATITSGCLPALAVYCQSCAESCPQDAIEIVSGQQPHIERTLCNGCGLCMTHCDFDAITLSA
ncbi:4Fe-4S binding protein [Vibrio zhugei]|uniref:4Fe-4S binding protein n=1 Tax=Vibrio zhugei TaxID=2479546 RepID=A0ABV7C9V6_9VIBR|nr:4Fe-4S binding protein [Vibrio zhugei]